MDKPKSFVIWFRNASHNHTAVYNQGLGNAVSFDRATRYASREEAERVSAQLTDNEVVEFAVPPPPPQPRHRNPVGFPPRPSPDPDPDGEPGNAPRPTPQGSSG